MSERPKPRTQKTFENLAGIKKMISGQDVVDFSLRKLIFRETWFGRFGKEICARYVNV